MNGSSDSQSVHLMCLCVCVFFFLFLSFFFWSFISNETLSLCHMTFGVAFEVSVKCHDMVKNAFMGALFC